MNPQTSEPVTTEKRIRPADTKPFAGSRDFGILIRKQIEHALGEGEQVVLDLAGVEDMTPSFADECLGRLSEERREDVTEHTVRVVSGEKFRPLISAVIRIRLQRALAHPHLDKLDPQ